MKSPQRQRRSPESTDKDRAGLNHAPDGETGEELVREGDEAIVKQPWTDSDSSDGSCCGSVDGYTNRVDPNTPATKSHISKQDVADENGLKNDQPTVEPRAANKQQVEAANSDGVSVGKHDVDPLAVDENIQPSNPDGLWVGELDLGSLVVTDQLGASRPNDIGLNKPDPEWLSVDSELGAGFSPHEDEQHDVKPLLGEDAPHPSAASVVASDHGEEIDENIVVANGPARGSEEERQMMARLSEIESGPAREDNEESEGGSRGADGGPWWERLCKIIIVFLMALNICTMVFLDLRSANISRRASVTTANTTTAAATTTTTTTPVSTTTGVLSFTKAMNSLVEKTGAIASYLTSTGASGDENANNDISSNSDDNESTSKTENKNKGKDNGLSKSTDEDKNKSKNKDSNKNKNKNKNKGKSQNKRNGDDDSASSKGGDTGAKPTRSSSQSGQREGQHEGRLRQRWKAWASEFEDMVDGPWV